MGGSPRVGCRPVGSMTLLAHVQHVHIGAESRVVGQVVARVAGIVVEDHVVTEPVPSAHVADIKGRDPEVEAVKEEAIRTSAAQTVDVLRTEAAGEVTMFPGVIEVIVRIASGMANPAAVVMDVGSLRVTIHVAEVAMIAGVVSRTTGKAAMVAATFRTTLGHKAAAYVAAAHPAAMFTATAWPLRHRRK